MCRAWRMKRSRYTAGEPKAACASRWAMKFPTQFVGVVGDTDATPAAASGGLDQQRIADLFGAGQRRVEVVQLAGRARHHRHPGGHRGTPRLGLVAHAADGLRIRTDEDQSGRLHRFGEGRVLGEETVAGMDRVGTGFPRRHENRLNIQVAPLGPRRADQTYLIGQPRGQRIAIRLCCTPLPWECPVPARRG